MTMILLLMSIVISKDVLDQYASKATSFKQYEKEVSEQESVTLVVGFWPLKKMDYPSSVPYQSYKQWEMGKDFTLSFGVTNYKVAQENIILENVEKNFSIFHSSIGRVIPSILTTKYGNYFKISANIVHVKSPFWAFVQITFNESIADEDIPFNDVFLSSEENSFGATMINWPDGKRLRYNKVQGFYWIEVQPTRVIKMKSQSKCSPLKYFSCMHDKLTNEDYKNCPRKCFSISTNANATPVCKTAEEFQCSHEITKRLKGICSIVLQNDYS